MRQFRLRCRPPLRPRRQHPPRPAARRNTHACQCHPLVSAGGSLRPRRRTGRGRPSSVRRFSTAGGRWTRMAGSAVPWLLSLRLAAGPRLPGSSFRTWCGTAAHPPSGPSRRWCTRCSTRTRPRTGTARAADGCSSVALRATQASSQSGPGFPLATEKFSNEY
jgi:hypothetical protein